jgi:hypothetical protein
VIIDDSNHLVMPPLLESWINECSRAPQRRRESRATAGERHWSEADKGQGHEESALIIGTATSSGGFGGLVQRLKAPLAIAVDAISFLASAVLIARIETRELHPTRSERDGPFWQSALLGIREVRRSAPLRALAISLAASGVIREAPLSLAIHTAHHTWPSSTTSWS